MQKLIKEKQEMSQSFFTKGTFLYVGAGNNGTPDELCLNPFLPKVHSYNLRGADLRYANLRVSILFYQRYIPIISRGGGIFR